MKSGDKSAFDSNSMTCSRTVSEVEVDNYQADKVGP